LSSRRWVTSFKWDWSSDVCSSDLASQPVAERVRDLLGRMTPEEKFWQLFMIPGSLDNPAHDYSHGVFGLQIAPADSAGGARAHAERINAIQRFFVERTRLGIPIIPF